MYNKNRPQREMIEDCLHPLNGYRGQLQAQGKEVKNHMKEHRAALRKTAEAFVKKREIESQVQNDPFKMRKFQNVQSKIKQEIQNQNAQDDVRPVQGRQIGKRPGSAAGPKPGQQAAFGRSYSNSNNQPIGAQKQSKVKFDLPRSSAGGQGGTLNKNDLDLLNSRTKVDKMKEIDSQIYEENINTSNVNLPPKTPNYGKIPKYIEKYREEAKVKEDAKLELQAAKMRPAGTKVLGEDERIKTLERLNANKKDLNKILCQMPISMRTESLRKQKIEIEQKLIEIEKAIDMFSRKIVFIKDE